MSKKKKKVYDEEFGRWLARQQERERTGATRSATEAETIVRMMLLAERERQGADWSDVAFEDTALDGQTFGQLAALASPTLGIPVDPAQD